MAVEGGLSTPRAIVLAGALIAAGLFFGLRESRIPSGPAAPAALPSSATGPQPAPPRVDVAAVRAAAEKALERSRAEVVKACVAPALAKSPDPPRIKLVFNVTFDAEGRQIARGVMEDRETSRAGVSTCVMDTVPPIAVPPPGASVMVEVPWTLP